jgi:hypothetical protein
MDPSSFGISCGILGLERLGNRNIGMNKIASFEKQKQTMR